MTHLPIPGDIGEYLQYDPDTGLVTIVKQWWQKSKLKVGQVWGTWTGDGYFRGGFRWKRYRIHRIIWFLQTGVDLGAHTPDHINGIRSDNRWCNLRLAKGQHEQQLNVGALGYYWQKSTKRFQAQFKTDGNVQFLGLHQCPLLARIAYHDYVSDQYPDFAPPFIPRRPIIGRPDIGIRKM